MQILADVKTGKHYAQQLSIVSGMRVACSAVRIGRVSERFFKRVVLNRSPNSRNVAWLLSVFDEPGISNMFPVLFENFKSVVLNRSPNSRKWTKFHFCHLLKKTLTICWIRSLKCGHILKSVVLGRALKAPECWTISDGFVFNCCPICPKCQKCNLLIKNLTSCRYHCQNGFAQVMSKLSKLWFMQYRPSLPGRCSKRVRVSKINYGPRCTVCGPSI